MQHFDAYNIREATIFEILYLFWQKDWLIDKLSTVTLPRMRAEGLINAYFRVLTEFPIITIPVYIYLKLSDCKK